MDIKEIKYEKHKLQEAIHKMITQFESNTGAKVNRIELQRVYYTGGGMQLLPVVVEVGIEDD